MYPVDSPGGWQIIGRTPLRLFAPERETPFLYEAGDRIRFVPVSGGEYESIRAKEGT
jgi:inhibitor of KinA